jgi:thiaminase/transcriptional activator TenA
MTASEARLFSQQVWSEHSVLIRAILDLPFNHELAQGVLSLERFVHYLAQDRFYLRRYIRALSLCAAKSPDEAGLDFFARSAHAAIAVERTMHAGLLDRLGVTERQLGDHRELTPVCQAYTDFLLAACFEQPYPVAIAAVLPCFWIYQEVGMTIANRSVAGNPFQPWIDTYNDESFAEAVRSAIHLFDEASASASASTRESMRQAFRRSTQYEWMFWDSAYRLAGWPI